MANVNREMGKFGAVSQGLSCKFQIKLAERSDLSCPNIELQKGVD